MPSVRHWGRDDAKHYARRCSPECHLSASVHIFCHVHLLRSYSKRERETQREPEIAILAQAVSGSRGRWPLCPLSFLVSACLRPPPLNQGLSLLFLSAIPILTRSHDIDRGVLALLELIALARDLVVSGSRGLVRAAREPYPEAHQLPHRQPRLDCRERPTQDFKGSPISAPQQRGDTPMTPRPNKRHCGGGETLALQMLQDTLRGELSRERAELRNEINRALKGVTARVDAIEKGLQQHGSRTLQAVKTLTTLQAEQGEKIQTIITDTAVLGQRLAALEGKVRDIQSAGSSTSTHDSGRVTALDHGRMASRHTRSRRPR